MKKRTQTFFVIILIQIIVITQSGCFESPSPPAVLGDYARDYLQGTKYSRLIIEIDFVNGFEPSAVAVNTLEQRIDTYSDKSEVMNLQKGFAQTSSRYSDEDIRNLEKEHRDYHKRGSDIVAYVLYLNGEYAADSNVLGIAYGPSSIAIFKERIYDIDIPWYATNRVEKSDYEKSVLVHEFGHLLAMVNFGYKSDRNHESSHDHHCKHMECVMYYAIETVDIIDILTQEDPVPPSDFYVDCQYDLGQLKSGGY